MSAAPSEVSAPVRSPANRASMPSRIVATSVSRSSRALHRVEDAGRLGAHGIPAWRLQADERLAVVASPGPRRGRRRAGRRGPRAVTPSANAASIGATLRSSSRSCCAATDAPRAIVKSYSGSTSSRAAWRARSVRTSLVYCSVRGACTFAGAGLPSSSSVWAGRTSRPRITDIAAISRTDARIRRPASRRVKRLAGSAVRASMAFGPPTKEVSAPCRGRRGRRGRAPGRRGPRRPCRRRGRGCAGESQPMTLPRSRAEAAPVSATPWSTSARSSSSVRAVGRYSARMAISASSFVARSSRPPLRKASTLSRRVFVSRVITPRMSSSVSVTFLLFSVL